LLEPLRVQGKEGERERARRSPERGEVQIGEEKSREERRKKVPLALRVLSL